MQNPRTRERLASLKPEVAVLVSELLELGYKNGLNPQVTSGYRSPMEQEALYAQGRTTKGPKVTNARKYQSAHNWKVAADIHFITPDGKASWDRAFYLKLWKLAVAAGLEARGLEWGYNWKSFPEMPHFQMRGFNWRQSCVQNGIDPITLNPLPKKQPAP